MAEQYILFQVANATYAVRAEQVQQVEMVENVTFVPNAPAYVDGVVYLRGEVVPLISMRARFQLEKIDNDLRTRLLVTRVNGRVIGLVVDSAREFVQIEPDQVQPPPDDLASPGLAYLEGVVVREKRIILLINLQKMLDQQERETLEDSIRLEK